MYTMSQINHIKDLSNCGYRISEISKKTGADPKTIRKYLSQEDFSPVSPVVQTQPSKLDPFKPVIQEWLDEDKKHWRKQHHTAQRIYERLVEEQGYTGSYSVVQRYLKKCRSVQTEKANLELVWDPGPAQVDFGEADFYESGKLIRKKYLTLSFPYSNDGYSQVFGGETAECVCQGLVDIFEFIGGVPPMLIFDNATGVGRRIGDVIHETELFSRFHAHYHFRVRFCNPYSGWENFSREELESLEFVPGQKNLVLYGLVGVGKTHMAIAAGVKACNLGYKTKFYTVTELVLKLAESRKNGTLEKLLRDLRSLDLLILDEWGYVPVDKDGSQLLFRVISDSYERKSLILTTNLEFSKWGGIFTDDQMAAAMTDRLVHHFHQRLSYKL